MAGQSDSSVCGLAVDGTLTAAGVNVFNYATLGGDGDITLASGNLYYPGNESSTFAGSIAGSGGIDLANGQLALSGVSSYAGDTVVEGSGLLRIGRNDALPSGSTAGNVQVWAAALDLAGYTLNVNALNGNGVIDDSTGSGTLLAGNNDASRSFYGTIQNSGGTLSLVKVGSGAFTLSGPDTYGGGTEVDSGTLRLGNPTALGTGGLTVDGGTLDLGGYSVTVSGFSGNGGVVTNDGSGRLTLTVGQGRHDLLRGHPGRQRAHRPHPFPG